MANPAQNKDRAAVQSGLNDLLGNVIRSDRQRAGRGEASAPSEPPAQPVATPGPPSELSGPRPLETNPLDTMTDTHSDVMTDEALSGTDGLLSGSPEATAPTRAARPKAGGAGSAHTPTARPAQAQAKRKTAPTSVKASASEAELLSARVDEAAELAATPTITVTLRIPQGFNAWLDGYVHGSWPEKIRKQELVVEGLMLAFARRGQAGETIIGTALLGETEDAEGS